MPMKPSDGLTSHESFSHDSLSSLAYDWERIGNPHIAPKLPFKVYLPMTTEDVVAAVRETQKLGQTLRVRSKGHSSNDLVLSDRGHVLCTQMMNKVIALDVLGNTVQVQPGVVLAELDTQLSEHGCGLPIIGDHNHITAGGFASVGGISPASHRFGMFVDNVLAVEYVTWEGEVRNASREREPEELLRVLTGLSRQGVITTLTLRIIHVDKFKRIYANDRAMFLDMHKFVAEAQRRIENPGDSVMERGVWVDFAVGAKSVGVGQFSSYYETKQSWLKSAVNRVHYGYLHGLGRFAGELPTAIDVTVKYMGMVGIMLSPRFASLKNVETFTDRVLDSSVGDPTRMFIVLAPVSRFSTLFFRIHSLFLDVRKSTGAFTFVSIYTKAIHSPYLAVNNDGKYSELMVYCGINPEKMTSQILEDVVSRLDDIVIEEGALRYMHSKTVSDKERRRLIDPNQLRGRIAEDRSRGETQAQPVMASTNVST
jgi:hypothetical protein